MCRVCARTHKLTNEVFVHAYVVHAYTSFTLTRVNKIWPSVRTETNPNKCIIQLNMFILAEIVCDKQIICLAGCTAANWDFYFMLPSTLSLLGSPLSVSTFIHTIKSIITMVYYLFACLFVFVVVFFLITCYSFAQRSNGLSMVLCPI